MVYAQAAKQETHYTGDSIGVQINIALNRDISQKEDNEISAHARAIVNILRRNTLLNDPTEIEQRAKERADILACFPPGIAIYVKEIANGYYSESVNPWFEVTTPKGIIQIGWRKRVINIDWSGLDNIIHADTLCNEGDITTRGISFIHAWGYEKAKEYLSTILK